MGKLNCMVSMTTSFPSSLRGIILASKKPLAKILPALAEDAGGHFGHVPVSCEIPETGPEQEQIEALSTNFLGLSTMNNFFSRKGGHSNENKRVQNNPRFLNHVNLIVSSNTHTSALTRHPPTSTYAKDIGSC